MPVQPAGSRFQDPKYAARFSDAIGGLAMPLGVAEAEVIPEGLSLLDRYLNSQRYTAQQLLPGKDAELSNYYYGQLKSLFEPFRKLSMGQLLDPTFDLSQASDAWLPGGGSLLDAMRESISPARKQLELLLGVDK